MRVIPLYNPEAILKAWPLLTPGLERVLEFSNGDDDLTLVLNEALAGHLLIWLVLDDGGVYSGFTTTCIRVSGTHPPHKYLVFNHTYKHPKADFHKFIEAILEITTEFAEKQGCDSMRLYSLRPLEKMVKAFGFKPSYVEYVKELKNDG